MGVGGSLGQIGGLLGHTKQPEDAEIVWSKTANTMLPIAAAAWGVKNFER